MCSIIPKDSCQKSVNAFILLLSFFVVLQPKSQHCNSPQTVSVKDGSGFLSSTISEDSSCGTSEAPWILEASPGQRINLTIIDFGWGVSHNLLNKCPVLYGHYLDYTDDGDIIDICGGTSRMKKLVLTQSHQVQIILNEGAVQNSRFIIKYEGEINMLTVGIKDKRKFKFLKRTILGFCTDGLSTGLISYLKSIRLLSLAIA